MLVYYDRDLLSNSVDSVLNVILPYLGLGGETDLNPGVVRERVSKVLDKKSNHGSNGSVLPDWSPVEGGAVVGVSEKVRATRGLFMRESAESLSPSPQLSPGINRNGDAPRTMTTSSLSPRRWQQQRLSHKDYDNNDKRGMMANTAAVFVIIATMAATTYPPMARSSDWQD